MSFLNIGIFGFVAVLVQSVPALLVPITSYSAPHELGAGASTLRNRAVRNGRETIERPVMLTANPRAEAHFVVEPLAGSSWQWHALYFKSICGFLCRWVLGRLLLATLHTGMVVSLLTDYTGLGTCYSYSGTSFEHMRTTPQTGYDDL